MRKIASVVIASTALAGVAFVELEGAQASNPACTSTTSTYMNGAVEMTVRTFSTVTAGCDWRIPSAVHSIKVLAIGGGGGGGGGASALGGRAGGGGGGGGAETGWIGTPSGAEIMTIVVGAGGAAGGGPNNIAGQLAVCGSAGQASSFAVTIGVNNWSYSSPGGGGGGAGGVESDCSTANSAIGGDGGSSYSGGYSGGLHVGKQGGSGASSKDPGADGSTLKTAGELRDITGASVEYGPGGGGSNETTWGAEPTAFGSGGQGGRGSLSTSGTYTYGYAGSRGLNGVVIVAYPTPTTASVNFVTAAHGTAAAATSPVAINGSTTITATPDAGYKFDSWSCTGGTLSSTTANPATLSAVTEDAFCTPTFSVFTPALTVVNTPGIAWIASPATTTYGGSFTMSATPGVGVIFTGWSCTNGTLSSSTDASVTLSNVTADVTCTPGATPQTFTVTLGAMTNGTAVVATSPVNYNGSVTLTATADAAYEFASWSCTAGTLSSTTSNPATLSNVTADAVCTAVFSLIDVTPTPTIGGITPAFGPTTGGTTITINGSNFDSPTVTIGGHACVIVNSSATQITCIVPAGTAGGADVVVDNGGGHTDSVSGGFTYQVPRALDIPKKPKPSQAKVTLGGGSLKIEMTYDGTDEFKPSGYTAYVKPGGNSCIIPQGATTCEIIGLKPGVEYTLVITAVNAAGISQSLTMPETYLIGEKSPLKLFAKLGIRPFGGDSAVMTKAFRAQIRKFVSANPKLTAFTCTGYTAGTPVLKSDRNLAKARASAVCGYIAKLRPTAAVTVIGLTPGLSFAANNRKVLVKGFGLDG